MRRTVVLVAMALAGALTPAASEAVGGTCVTGRPEIYSGCTYIVIFPGYCYIRSGGTILGMPYNQGPVPC